MHTLLSKNFKLCDANDTDWYPVTIYSRLLLVMTLLNGNSCYMICNAVIGTIQYNIMLNTPDKWELPSCPN